jgi:aminoglycoside phosphotransferase
MMVHPAALGLPFDPAVPHRDVLLDDASAAAVLSRALLPAGRSFHHVRRISAKYRRGESVRAQFRVQIDGATRLVSLRMVPGRSGALYEKALRSAVPCGPLSGVGHDPALQAVFWTYPNDRVLHQASRLAPGLPVIQQACPGATAFDVVSFTQEQAVVAAIRTDDRVTGFAKATAPGVGATACRCYDWVLAHEPASATRVPRVVAQDAALDVFVVDAVQGMHVRALAPGAYLDAFGAFGRAVARLHDVPPPSWEAFGDFTPAHLHESAALAEWAASDVSGVARRTADALGRCRPDGGEIVCLHGDLNSRNWLVHEGEVALIDLDRLVSGPAAADLGSVLSWVITREVSGELTPAFSRRVQQRFLAGYASLRPLPDADDLSWFTAASLLAERAPRAVRRLYAEHVPHLTTLAARAYAIAHGVGRD